MISEAPRAGFRSIVAGLAEPGHLRVYGAILGAIIASTLLLTLFDRRYDPKFPTRWREGLAESFYTVMSVVTTGKPPPANQVLRMGRSRLVGAVAGLRPRDHRLRHLIGDQRDDDDRSHREDRQRVGPAKAHVGVLDGATAEEYARAAGLRMTAFPNIDRAIDALIAGEVDAVVGDAPVLDYYALTRPQRDVRVVGERFEPEKYGFGIARDSALRRPLTVALIGAEEDGVTEDVRTKYFGPRQ